MVKYLTLLDRLIGLSRASYLFNVLVCFHLQGTRPTLLYFTIFFQLMRIPDFLFSYQPISLSSHLFIYPFIHLSIHSINQINNNLLLLRTILLLLLYHYHYHYYCYHHYGYGPIKPINPQWAKLPFSLCARTTPCLTHNNYLLFFFFFFFLSARRQSCLLFLLLPFPLSLALSLIISHFLLST